MPFDSASYERPKTVASQMRDLFQDGEGWCKKHYCMNRPEKPAVQYCIIGAFATVMGRKYPFNYDHRAFVVGLKDPSFEHLLQACQRRSLWGLILVSEPPKTIQQVEKLNDHPGTKWKDIAKILDRMERIEQRALANVR